MVMYSPKVHFNAREPCQALTAIGRLIGTNVYRYDMGNGFVPHRRDVDFHPCREVPIRPLIDDLEFISNKRHWGADFRFGLREIPEVDFQLIAIRMLGQSVV